MATPTGATRADADLDRDAAALYRTLTALTRVYQFRDRDRICCRGISVTQCYALEALVWHGPLTLSALAGHLYLEKSTVSRVVDALERKGYASRRPHERDRRAVLLGPTPEGEALCAEIQSDMVERERELIRDFEPAVRAQMLELIGRLTREAEERAEAMAKGCPSEE